MIIPPEAKAGQWETGKESSITQMEQWSNQGVWWQFQNIVKKLNPGGFLVKGAHETIPQTGVSLVRAYDQADIFIKSYH